jgi:hypothetical protein
MAKKLDAERLLETILNSSIPDALYTIPFAGVGTKNVKGEGLGVRVKLEDGRSFLLRVETDNEPEIKNMEKAREALRRLVHTINDTGGATVDRKGYTVPAVDQEWSDLGDAYEAACAALGLEPDIDDARADHIQEDEDNG